MYTTYLKAIILGIVEGLTEFLPVSSTGHMILVDEFLQLSANQTFVNAFQIIIQSAAILAVIIFFWSRLWIFDKGWQLKKEVLILWSKVLVGVVPAFILGFLFDDLIDTYLFNPRVVALALVFYGAILIWLEKRKYTTNIHTANNVTYGLALLIGLAQCLAMVPGTSRSAATIISGMLLGLSRVAAAEISFFLAIPTMLGATVLKLLKVGFSFTTTEWLVLLTGSLTSFLVAFVVIKYFMQFIQKHTFISFGWYRIVLGIIVLTYFLFK